jgi:hypothetical protein
MPSNTALLIAAGTSAAVGSPAPIEAQLFLQDAAHGLHNIPFNLISQTIRIDDLAAVVRDEEFLCCNVTGLTIYFDFTNHTDVSSHELILDVGQTSADARGRVPIGFWPLSPPT